MTKPIEKWATYVWPAGEVWKEVPGFPGYQVSDEGRIRSLRRTNARLCKTEVDEDGYHRLSLSLGATRVHQVLSRLVALAFHGPAPAGKPICRHLDGDTNNNRPGNLAWSTQAENMADKVRHGTAQVGSTHPRAVIDEAVARAVKQRLAATAMRHGLLKEIAADLGISFNIVASISRGRTWGHAC